MTSANDNRMTELLRKLLDERGVEWADQFGPFPVTAYEGDGVTWIAKEYTAGKFSIETRPVTPEQAIAATLGSDTKPCYATDYTHEHCKYSVNRGWVENVAYGTLTAEQVREAIEANSWAETSTIREFNDSSWQAIADELNALMGSDAKPCYAADENYKRCKYSVNRGWCDNAPFLVWDDTGHLFITMGGLKTWDVTDDAKKWFAELGSGTCELDYDRHCSNCGVCVHEDAVLVRKHLDGGTWTVVSKPANYCPNCGARIRKAVKR